LNVNRGGTNNQLKASMEHTQAIKETEVGSHMPAMALPSTKSKAWFPRFKMPSQNQSKSHVSIQLSKPNHRFPNSGTM
jgi:hypothetical protein